MYFYMTYMAFQKENKTNLTFIVLMCQSFPLHKKVGNKKKYIHLFSFQIPKVMNIYRSWSPVVICNAKCSIPTNNLKETALYIIMQIDFLRKRKKQKWQYANMAAALNTMRIIKIQSVCSCPEPFFT